MVVPYTIEFLESTPPTDITGFVRLDKLTDVGSGEVNSAQMMLESSYGKYLTDARGGETPIIDQFNRYRITLQDSNSVIYSRIMIVDTKLPQQGDTGQLVQIEMFGRERYLQRMKFPGHFFFIRHRDLLQQTIDFYNTHRGTRQPRIVTELNGESTIEVPAYPVGIFVYTENSTVYSTLFDIVNRLNLSVQAGGAGDYFELLFEDVDEDTMVMRVLSQGSRGDITIEGKDSDTIEILETQAPIDSTIVVAEGQDETGTMPVEIARWNSLREEYLNFPEWESTGGYVQGVRVRLGGRRGRVYRATADIDEGVRPPGGAWTLESEGDYIGRNFVYSPWTKNRVAQWRNYTTDPTSNFNIDLDSMAFPDSNLVIRDFSFWRNDVDFRVRRLEDIPNDYLYSGTGPLSERVYEGMTLALDSSLGSPGADFANGNSWGTDPSGSSYENSIVRLSESGRWIVIRGTNPSNSANTLQRFDQIVVMRKSNVTNPGVFEWNRVTNERSAAMRAEESASTSDLGWRDTRGYFYGYDCLHFPAEISQTRGFFDDVENPGGGRFADNSAVRIAYEFEITDDYADIFRIVRNAISIALGPIGILGNAAVDLLFSHSTYNFGWWATLFETPNPVSGRGGIPVGGIFGGTISNKVPVLDLYNLNFTPSGQSGFMADDAENLGPLTGIHFMFNYDITVGSTRVPFIGDIPFRCAITDTLGDVWIQDVVVRHLAETQQIILPFSGFRIYRARNPIGVNVDDVVQVILNPELAVLEVFETRKIKRIVFHELRSYDDNGRFQPANLFNFLASIADNITGVPIRTSGIIDVVGFMKKPIAIRKAPDADELHIQTDVRRYPNISNVEQLGKVAQAELSLAQWRQDTFNIKTTGFCDIKPGNSIILNEPDIVDASLSTFAVKKITYSVYSTDGIGGFLRDLSAYRRINFGG